MTIDQFKSKLSELHNKAEMDLAVCCPFVYDTDELGLICIDEAGQLHFEERTHHSWIKSHLMLKDIVNMHFSKEYFDPKFQNDEDDDLWLSSIYLFFASGESMELRYDHCDGDIEVFVDLIQTKSNQQIIEALPACYQRGVLIFRLFNGVGFGVFAPFEEIADAQAREWLSKHSSNNTENIAE